MIPGHQLLPDPEILQKLKAIDPSAPDLIMDMAESIAMDRRQKETSGATRAFLNRPFTEKLTSIFGGTAYSVPTSADETINQSFATVGDDLRQAILIYMQDKGLSPRATGLTDHEYRSLSYVSTSRYGYTRPAAPPL